MPLRVVDFDNALIAAFDPLPRPRFPAPLLMLNLLQFLERADYGGHPLTREGKRPELHPGYSEVHA